MGNCCADHATASTRKSLHCRNQITISTFYLLNKVTGNSFRVSYIGYRLWICIREYSVLISAGIMVITLFLSLSRQISGNISIKLLYLSYNCSLLSPVSNRPTARHYTISTLKQLPQEMWGFLNGGRWVTWGLISSTCQHADVLNTDRLFSKNAEPVKSSTGVTSRRSVFITASSDVTPRKWREFWRPRSGHAGINSVCYQLHGLESARKISQ